MAAGKNRVQDKTTAYREATVIGEKKQKARSRNKKQQTRAGGQRDAKELEA